MKKSLFTKYIIRVSAHQKSRVLSLILQSSLRYKYTEINEDKSLSIVIKKCDKDKFEKALKSSGIEANFEENKGLFSVFNGLKGRVGLLLGFIFVMLLLSYSSKTVWKISVQGNQNVEEDDILMQLREAGFTLGTYIPDIDYDELHNKVLLNSKNLSWISVNITGNVANVYVKEKIDGNSGASPLYTNVVAKEDGYISSIIVIDGKKTVSIGETVKKGDILISGVIASQSQGVRYEHASGKVEAYVNKKIEIKIPFKSEKKVYTGNRYTNKSYKIYNFPINFSAKYGNRSVFYDTIEKREKLSILGIEQIPVEIITTTYYEYILEPVTLTVQEAVDKGFVELKKQLDEKLKNAELINKSVKTSYDKENFYIYCELYCLEDIAKEQEFYISN